MKKTTAFIVCFALILVSGQKTVEDNTKNTTKINPSEAKVSDTELSAAVKNKIVITTLASPSSTTNKPTDPTPTSSSSPQTPITIQSPSDVPIQPWNLTVGNDTALVQMDIHMNITYTDTNNKTQSTAINVPRGNGTSVTGNFSLNDEIMNLTWVSGLLHHSVSLHFNKYGKSYALKNIEVLIDPKSFSNVSDEAIKLVYNQTIFNATLGESYRCLREQSFDLSSTSGTKVSGQMKVSESKIQAFKTDKKEGFGSPQDCILEISDTVPIVVGFILASLVIIVLVVYLISRRRSQARGYLSM